MLLSIRTLQFNIAITFFSWMQEFWNLAQTQSLSKYDERQFFFLFFPSRKWYFCRAPMLSVWYLQWQARVYDILRVFYPSHDFRYDVLELLRYRIWIFASILLQRFILKQDRGAPTRNIRESLLVERVISSPNMFWRISWTSDRFVLYFLI